MPKLKNRNKIFLKPEDVLKWRYDLVDLKWSMADLADATELDRRKIYSAFNDHVIWEDEKKIIDETIRLSKIAIG